LGARVAVVGRSRNDTDIDTFALALDVLLAGLKRDIAERQDNEVTTGKGGL
jgi:hypothetical protein